MTHTPSYEKYIEGCECKSCKQAFKDRIEARKSFKYYESPRKIPRVRNGHRRCRA